MNKNLRILILSTHRPSYSAGLGSDVMRCLKEGGHDVDFLCKYSTEFPKRGYKSIESRSAIKSICARFFSKRIKSLFYKSRPDSSPKDLYKEKGMIFNDSYEIHYPDECRPGFPVDQLLEHINKDYDLVITLWWFDFINSTALKEIYNKLHCPIMILSIDMAPVTGGCFYFNACRRFERECGKCIAIGSDDSNDFTHRNYLVKRDNYAAINCAFLGNSWMNEFALRSGLFPKKNIFKIGCIIDENEFIPADRRELRSELGLAHDSIILLARSSKELRKGARFIIHAINTLPERFTERCSIVLVSIGDECLREHIQNKHIRHEYMGRIDRKALIKLYQISDFFLSPSIDDAGPSMVNQSQMCGTPVVCFNNGTAVDVVINGQSGFKTDDISEKGFSEILYRAIDMACNDKVSYDELRVTTRSTALMTSSKARFQENIMEYYQKMTS